MPAPGPTPSGREPAGATRVGCIGLRSPGRSGGRGAPGTGGREVRWKIGCPGTGRPGAGLEAAFGADVDADAGGGAGARYTGRGPVCGMIMRGGGATGAAGRALGICETFPAGGAAADAVVLGGAAGGTARGGTAMAGGAALAVDAGAPALGAADAGGTLGGMTTTEGGRYVAATDAGVTILGAGAGASAAGLGGVALGAVGASALVSAAGDGTGGLATGRAAGGSATAFCWVIARSTSPGREIFDKSILVLIPSSLGAERAVFDWLGAASERPLRRCLRTRSAS
jgi:hypothetical protein